jgi:glycosyltransferase involved in cell wall biosynthesis
VATFAITMVKDEADIIASTVGHLLGQVDEILVLDNGSTDGTRELLAELPVAVSDDPEVGYHQSRKMTDLARRAGELGADWVIPFDADEVWYSPFGRIADVLADVPARTAPAALFDHVATGLDPEDPDPIRRIGWRRREPALLPKVACRPRVEVTIQQGNHAASYRGGVEAGLLVVRHYPYRSADQFVRKARNGAAAYAATDLPATEGAHWRQYGAILEAHGPEALGDVFRQWFWTADPASDPTLIFDPAPA